MDIRIEDHGSIVLLRPENAMARQWLLDHVADDAQWFGGEYAALAVEPRYVADIVQGADEDGLEVE